MDSLLRAAWRTSAQEIEKAVKRSPLFRHPEVIILEWDDLLMPGSEPFRYEGTLDSAAAYFGFERDEIPSWFRVWKGAAARKYLLSLIRQSTPAERFNNTQAHLKEQAWDNADLDTIWRHPYVCIIRPKSGLTWYVCQRGDVYGKPALRTLLDQPQTEFLHGAEAYT